MATAKIWLGSLVVAAIGTALAVGCSSAPSDETTTSTSADISVSCVVENTQPIPWLLNPETCRCNYEDKRTQAECEYESSLLDCLARARYTGMDFPKTCEALPVKYQVLAADKRYWDDFTFGSIGLDCGQQNAVFECVTAVNAEKSYGSYKYNKDPIDAQLLPRCNPTPGCALKYPGLLLDDVYDPCQTRECKTIQ